MVIQELMNKLKFEISNYGINSTEAYSTSKRIAIELDNLYLKNTLEEHYYISFQALTKYIMENEDNPSENRWNKYAIKNRYLSSQTMGYIYEKGFNKLCKQIRKEI